MTRVLVFRLGSIGDFVVALPALHLLRRRFPGAQIALLTNRPETSVTGPASSILDGTGLIDTYLSYSIGERNLGTLSGLRRQILDFAPDFLVFLTDRPKFWDVVRDTFFFRICGARMIVGAPFSTRLRHCQPISTSPYLLEREANRLARCLETFGSAESDRAASWDLHLNSSETSVADRAVRGGLASGAGATRFIAFSVGTKQPINDWGVANWRTVMDAVRQPDIAVLVVGGDADRAASREILKNWTGPVIDLCGQLSPRASAAVLGNAEFLLCHDSGPMHLAAAVGTRCIAVFSRLNPPGRWYPFGDHHRIFYPAEAGHTIKDISPLEVAGVVQSFLEKPAPDPTHKSAIPNGLRFGT
jgi:ADP-heptose:LPS heptosyltransferase